MPIRAFLAGKSFDPETIATLNAAFQGVCAALGVSDKARHSREIVAKKVLELADRHRDPKELSTAVIASLLGRGPEQGGSTPPSAAQDALDNRIQYQLATTERQLRADQQQLHAICSRLLRTQEAIERATSALAESRMLLAQSKPREGGDPT